MRYQPLSSSFYKNARNKFGKLLAQKSLAIFNSNDIYPIGADSTMPFQQHRDIFYLCGVDQEESILLLFPDAVEAKHREILFLRETNDHIAVWEGAKLSKKQAVQLTGIETIYWLSEFNRVFQELSTQCERFYFNTNEHYRQAVETQTREDRFIKWCKKQYPAHGVAKSNPILQQLRSVKDEEEIAQIQQACDITEKGFRRVLSFIKPKVWEYEIEAELIHEFIRNRSRGFAYTPIIAAGNNANVLHYTENNQELKDGDLLLIDAGCEINGYASDITRTFPVNGKFSEAQKEIYDVVLNAQKSAINSIKPGVSSNKPHETACEIITNGLIKLGIMKSAEDLTKFYMHNTGHWLGLDVHDVGSKLINDEFREFKSGMVTTVEPGIYIRRDDKIDSKYWGIGIRIEDDVLVTETGNHVLSEKAIKDIDEIEHLMSQR